MIRPLRDILVLRPLTKEPGKVGYVWMPEVGKQECASSGTCEVLVAGPKAECVPGDRVLLKVYDGHYANQAIVEHGGEKLVLIRERDIVGRIS